MRARVATISAVVACAAALLGPAGAGAAGACITRLPVSVQLPSPFAGNYTSTMNVTVAPRGGVTVRGLHVALYTFSGELLGQSSRAVTLRSSKSVAIRLRFPMQVGKFTLVASGETNANSSCGPKQTQHVLKLRGCDTSLPIKFTMLPGGTASDYRDTLSFSMKPTDGSLLRDLAVTVSSFNGSVFGATKAPALFGEEAVNIPLAQTLLAGGYSIFVQGAISGEPKSCGQKSATTIIQFA